MGEAMGIQSLWCWQVQTDAHVEPSWPQVHTPEPRQARKRWCWNNEVTVQKTKNLALRILCTPKLTQDGLQT